MKHIFIVTIEASYDAPVWKIKQEVEKAFDDSPLWDAKIKVTKQSRNVNN